MVAAERGVGHHDRVAGASELRQATAIAVGGVAIDVAIREREVPALGKDPAAVTVGRVAVDDGLVDGELSVGVDAPALGAGIIAGRGEPVDHTTPADDAVVDAARVINVDAAAVAA